MLTPAQRLAREGKLTASRVACLMEGNKEKIMEVWRELCGDPLYIEPNLDDLWPVQLGVVTEPLNLEWYSKKTGHALTRHGEVVQHPDYEWAAATLDAFDILVPGPIEAKCVGGFETIEKVIERYQPQIQWQLEVTQCSKAILSVIEGGRVPRLVPIDRDKAYADELMARALRLMEHVWNMTEPVVLDPVELKVISRLKDYNMIGNNGWAAAAADWLQHQKASKLFDAAEKKIRELVPNDASTATGYSIVAKRDRANRLSIRGINDEKPARKSK